MNALHMMYMVSHPLRISRYGAHTSLSSAERVEIIDTLTQSLGTALSILAPLKRGQQKLCNVSFLPLQDLFRKLVQENVDFTDFLVSGIRDLGGYAEVATLFSLNDTYESKCFADCLRGIYLGVHRLQATDTVFREYRERAFTNKDSASIRYFDQCIHRNTRFLASIKNHLIETESW
jgi:hypothetical protein